MSIQATERNSMNTWLIAAFLLLLSSCAQYNEADKTQFEIDSQTVLDTKSKLMWAPSDNRQSLTWQEAVDYCENYNGGGYEDWRMPTISELQTLIEAKIEKESDVINISSNMIWASEIDDSKAAFCHLANRGCSWMEQVISISLRALPVREGLARATGSQERLLPPRPQSTKQRFEILDLLYKQHLITEDEYIQKKAVILDEL